MAASLGGAGVGSGLSSVRFWTLHLAGCLSSGGLCPRPQVRGRVTLEVGKGVPEGEEGLGQPWGLVAGRFLGSLSAASGPRGFKTVGQLVSFIVEETKTTEVE